MCPLIQPDFSEVAEIKPGSYKARIAGCESRTSQKGATYLRWKLEVVENEDSRLNGRAFFHNTMLTGPGAGNVKTIIRAALDPTYEAGSVNTDDLLGKIVQATVVEGKNQDGTPNNFPEVKAISRVAV